MSGQNSQPLVGLVMGSNSDWPLMQNAAEQLESFDIAFEAKVVSAHRTPDLLYEYASAAKNRGLKCIIAGAGGAAHLPGMLAAMTPVPRARCTCALAPPSGAGFTAVHSTDAQRRARSNIRHRRGGSG